MSDADEAIEEKPAAKEKKVLGKLERVVAEFGRNLDLSRACLGECWVSTGAGMIRAPESEKAVPSNPAPQPSPAPKEKKNKQKKTGREIVAKLKKICRRIEIKLDCKGDIFKNAPSS